MKKLALFAFLGLMSAVPAMAQGEYSYENDRRYCASGRSGMDFNSCMRQLRHDRERQDRREYERREYEQRREYEGRQRWQEPAPVYVPEYQRQPQYQQERPKLSDMQERALNNCNLLAPRDQPRCRATVMSTVR
jgi:hypothetical protein